MNWVDFVILTVILAFAANGFQKGFFNQLLDIIGFLTSLALALTFYPQIAGLLLKFFNLPKIAASPISFVVIWIISESIFFAVLSHLFKKKAVPLIKSKINKYFGFIPATINALLFLAFVLLFVVSLPINPSVKKDIFNSKTGSILVEKATVFERPLNSVFGPIAKQSLTFLTIRTEGKESIQLGFTQNQLTFDLSSEQEMLELVNSERTKFGSDPLIWNESLSQVARSHSKDMFQRGYFSHYSKEDKDVGDRLDDANIRYLAAGENLALAPDVTRAHTGLMNSEGHRRNILDPAFKRIGIGTIDGGIYGKMFTQVFTD